MIDSLAIFLPCRKGSQRIKNKNIKPFADIEGGLTKIKLLQIARLDIVDKIYLSTNDDEIINIAQKLNISKLVIDQRSEYLCRNETTTDELITYVPTIIKEKHILWTHVTSPFINEDDYLEAIQKYFSLINSDKNDSLMSVTKLKKFVWNNTGPINYDRSSLKWPFTQTIDCLFEINSGIFISSLNNYIKFNDRIGIKPYMYELDSIKSFDIDWEEDFIVAEQIYKTTENKHSID